jgi:hypothetical protein
MRQFALVRVEDLGPRNLGRPALTERTSTDFMLTIYHLSPGYKLLEIWTANALTRQRTGSFESRPLVGQTHRQRYEILAEKMRDHGISPPPYDKKF